MSVCNHGGVTHEGDIRGKWGHGGLGRRPWDMCKTGTRPLVMGGRHEWMACIRTNRNRARLEVQLDQALTRKRSAEHEQ